MLNRFKKDKKSTNNTSEQQEPLIRELSKEEQEKFDKQKVDRDSVITALKQIGKTDEEISALLDPLSKEEQLDKFEELRQLYLAQKHAEVLAQGKDLYDYGKFTDPVKQYAGWLMGISAIIVEDKEYIEKLAQFAAIGYITVLKIEDPNCAPSVIEIMGMGEARVPGCMRSAAQKIFPVFRDYFGEDHEYTKGVEKYMA